MSFVTPEFYLIPSYLQGILPTTGRDPNTWTIWVPCKHPQSYWTGDSCMDSREVLRRLREDGWELKTTKGSHHQFVHRTKPGKVTVKHPLKDIPIGILRSIFRQAGWNWEEH